MVLYLYYVIRHNIASVFSQTKYGRHVSDNNGVEKKWKVEWESQILEYYQIVGI